MWHKTTLCYNNRTTFIIINITGDFFFAVAIFLCAHSLSLLCLRSCTVISNNLSYQVAKRSYESLGTIASTVWIWWFASLDLSRQIFQIKFKYTYHAEPVSFAIISFNRQQFRKRITAAHVFSTTWHRICIFNDCDVMPTWLFRSRASLANNLHDTKEKCS